MTALQRARGYLAKLPPAVAGQGGHSAAFQAACRLVEFGLCWDDAWTLFLEWNQGCLPPWSERDLHHKLADAFRRTKPRGDFAQRHRVCRKFSRPAIPPAPRPPVRPALPVGEQILSIPTTTRGTASELAQLAAIRGVSLHAVAWAVERGLIGFGLFRAVPAWFVLDNTRRIAQARRLDGLPWAPGVKAWTLRGSQARWPVGISMAPPGSTLAVVEGGPDILGLFEVALLTGRNDLAPVAMLGGQSRIHPEAVGYFRGRRVILFPHSDAAGQVTLTRWMEDIEAGKPDSVKVADLRNFPKAGIIPKDLNEFARVATKQLAEALIP